MLFTQLGLFTASLLLLACTQPPANTLTIGTNNWIGYQPLYVARSQGYFDGNPVKLVELNNTTDIIHALRTGQLDGAALTMDEVITSLEQGIDLSVIAVLDISNGGDALLVKPGYDSIQGLAGKKIAVEYSAVGATMLDAALSSAGMTLADIEVIPCTWDRHEECYALADAVITFEPVKTVLMKQGAINLFDSSQIKGRIVDVLSVRTPLLEENDAALRSLVQGYFRALELIQNQPDVASHIMQQRTRLKEAEIQAMLAGIDIPGLDGNHAMLDKAPFINDTQALVQLMLNNNLLQKHVSVNNLFTRAYLPPLP